MQSSGRVSASSSMEGARHFSVMSSKSSKDTLDADRDKYLDINFVIQEEPTTVILPVDSSDANEHCLTFYIRYVHKIGNKVHVIYVSEDFTKTKNLKPEPNKKRCCFNGNQEKPTPVVVAVGASPGILAELDREDKNKCNKIRHMVKTYFRTNGVLFEFHRLRSDDVAKAIVEYTVQARGDLIVMGSRGFGVIKKAIMGSVSDKVLKTADVPVVVVKNKPPLRGQQTTIN